MGVKTNIEWTKGGSTVTPIRARVTTSAGVKVGWHCEHVSEGCRNCYAGSFNLRLGTGRDYKPGELQNGVELFLDEKMLTAPLKWRKPRMIFMCSMTDMFADFVPDEWIDKIFAVMALAPHHTFQVLTKRPERMRAYINGHQSKIPYLGRMPLERIHLEAAGHMEGDGGYMDALKDAGNVYSLYLDAPWPLPNVWLGTSVEDQKTADARIPLLLDTPAAKRFISAEPLLGPVDLGALPFVKSCDCESHRPHFDALNATVYCAGCCDGPETLNTTHLDWVIVGGESGRGARPMHPDWVRSLRDQCAAAEVPFFFKQWGAWTFATKRGDPCRDDVPPPDTQPERVLETCLLTPDGKLHELYKGPGAYPDNCRAMVRIGKSRTGHFLDGREHREFPS